MERVWMMQGVLGGTYAIWDGADKPVKVVEGYSKARAFAMRYAKRTGKEFNGYAQDARAHCWGGPLR